jgi:hypothetical protein
LFEGEGSFLREAGWLRLQIRMTDLDPLERFAEIVGSRVLGPYCYQQDDGSVRKPFWVVQVNCRKVQPVVERMWPWLGTRRRARALELSPELGLLPWARP